MELARGQVRGLAALGVEVEGVGLVGGVDRDDEALVVALALEEELLGLDGNLGVVAPGEGLGAGTSGRAGVREGGHLVREVVPLGRVEGGAQLVVAEALLALDPPLGSVVDAGDAGHGEHEAEDRGQVGRVGQARRDARDVVVVDEVEQVLARVEVPGLASALALERVGDLVHVGLVEGRPQALVGLVVGDGVTGAVAHPLVVVAEHGLAHEDELAVALAKALGALGGQRVGDVAQVAEVADVEAVGDIEAQAVDVEGGLPVADHGREVVVEREVGVVELDEVGHALPGLVGEVVAVLVLAAEVDVEPAGVGALLAPL